MSAIGPISGQVSTEIAYGEYTANATINATTEGTAQTVIAAPAVVCDGTTPIVIEFQSTIALVPPTGQLFGILLDGATVLGRMFVIVNSNAANMSVPIVARQRIIPAAGSHTYTVKAYEANGVCYIEAGTGGTGALMAGFIRITHG